MSGCPNGCSQHHIANIGFYGASIKVGEHTIPAYVAHIGGHYEGGEVVYGTRLKVRLPAKRVPDAVERWMRMYEAERDEGEEFNAFAERVGTKALRGRGPRPRAAGRVQPRDDEPLHRLGAATCRSRSSAARASARSERQLTETLAQAVERHDASSSLCSFQKEESVLARRARSRIGAATRASSRSTPACCSPRRSRRGARSRTASACTIEVEDADRRRGPGPSTAAARAKVARARARARRRRRLDHRHPPRAGRRRARTPQLVEWDDKHGDLEVQPARRLDREGPLEAHPRARPALPPAARPAATPRSAARRARSPATAARAAGPAPTRPSAGCTSRDATRSSSSSASASACSSG